MDDLALAGNQMAFWLTRVVLGKPVPGSNAYVAVRDWRNALERAGAHDALTWLSEHGLDDTLSRQPDRRRRRCVALVLCPAP